MSLPRNRVRSISPRTRAAIKLVAFTDRVGGSLTVMINSFRLGIEAPEERRDEYRGSGRPLDW